MNDGLDPAYLTPVASLNRVRFTAMAGVDMPDGMVGWAAYALLSARALADLTARYGSADDAARRFGDRLGWLLVTLKRGDPASRAARPDWGGSYWSHWASVRQVYLGGGVISGMQGPTVAEYAERLLSRVGIADCSVTVAPWPEHLALIGAARAAPPAPTNLVLDFGHSFVKRALARYEDGTLTSLRLLPRMPARLTEIASGREPTAEETQQLGEYIVATMADTWRAAQTVAPDLSTTIVASLASYLRDGQPLARQGGAYAYLLGLSDNLATWLAMRLSTILDRQLEVRLIHDGTAAAFAMAGEADTAVITLGTALGVGFPSVSGPVRALSPRIEIVAANRT